MGPALVLPAPLVLQDVRKQACCAKEAIAKVFNLPRKRWWIAPAMANAPVSIKEESTRCT